METRFADRPTRVGFSNFPPLLRAGVYPKRAARPLHRPGAQLGGICLLAHAGGRALLLDDGHVATSFVLVEVLARRGALHLFPARVVEQYLGQGARRRLLALHPLAGHLLGHHPGVALAGYLGEAAREASHFKRASSAGHSPRPRSVRAYSTLGGTWA